VSYSAPEGGRGLAGRKLRLPSSSSRPQADSAVLLSELTLKPAEQILDSDHVVAVLDFAEATRDEGSRDPRHVVTGLPSLFPESVREVWRSPMPVSIGQDGAVDWVSGQFGLFATTTAHVPPGRDLAEISRKAWSSLLDTVAAMGCPHILRAWNHVPLINAGNGDDERYKRFCLGRYAAFESHRYAEGRFPAATAVGNSGDALVIYLLARSQPGRHFENPRQVSAPAYPRRYGPRPPSFARATSSGEGRLLFIAGTASIVGHRSCHPGDLTGQLAVTFDNIDRLLETVLGPEDACRGLDVVRVYLRDPKHLAAARKSLESRMPLAKAAYLYGDICRAELEVEIEGVRRL